MILEFDVGNTRTKWRLLNDNTVLNQGSFLGRDIESFSQLPVFPQNPDRVRIASVAQQQFQNELSDWCASRYGRDAEFAQTSASCAGVTNSYSEPARLGVDRWLAMLAAYNLAKNACCVIDCGSAITVDVLAADGCHQGGFIVPGLKMQESVLLNNTGRVRFDAMESRTFCTELGKNTLEAVQHGIVSMVVAWLDVQLKQAPIVFLTGGDAEFLAQGLRGEDVSIQADIVMQGLKFALP